MAISLSGVVIDCAEPRTVAEFWSAAIGGKVVMDMAEGAFLMVQAGGTETPYIGLQKVSEPRAGKNRAHPDFFAKDRPAEVIRLVGLGAKQLEEFSFDEFAWTVLADPDGNEFCVGGPVEAG
jgi:hypothetical protein